jgi:hypothetical protein
VQVEDPKNVLILLGNKVSQLVKDVLSDISKLKHDQAVKYTRKNDVHPFEAETAMQFFCERSDCALFCLGNHNKKRPNNIVLGRTFDAQLLDMVEVGVIEHIPTLRFPAAAKLQAGSTVCIPRVLSLCLPVANVRSMNGVRTGNREFKLVVLSMQGMCAHLWSVVQPAFVFLGDEFTRSQKHQQLKSLLVDMFQGSPALEVNAMAVRRVFVCSALSCGRVSLRQYSIQLMNAAGSKVCLAPALRRLRHKSCLFQCMMVSDVCTLQSMRTVFLVDPHLRGFLALNLKLGMHKRWLLCAFLVSYFLSPWNQRTP